MKSLRSSHRSPLISAPFHICSQSLRTEIRNQAEVVERTSSHCTSKWLLDRDRVRFHNRETRGRGAYIIPIVGVRGLGTRAEILGGKLHLHPAIPAVAAKAKLICQLQRVIRDDRLGFRGSSRIARHPNYGK